MTLKIEDYALIGDCHTAALVGRDGSIDWLCWPRFDSAACFTALLGGPEHGRWLICPSNKNAAVRRRYRENTLILETEFETAAGAGDTVPFVLTHSPSHLAAPKSVDAKKALEETETLWKKWTRQCTVECEWGDAVRRSLITLKALTYAPTGGMVAAASTSLPERLGGVRNWDYRYCWLRDATLTL